MTILLVASGGGHLRELHSLATRLELDDDRLWVTYESDMSTSLLAGENVVWVRYAPPRDLWAVAAEIPAAVRTLRRHRPRLAVSTGASLAVLWLPAAAAHGARSHYIETATRVAGPSMSMRLLRAAPGVRLHTQTTRWTRRRVGYVGSVFDGYTNHSRLLALGPGPLRIFVTVGTTQVYQFSRLITRVLEIAPPGSEILWQVAPADVENAPEGAQVRMTSEEIFKAHRWADVVIAHAGVGSALTAFDTGHCPVLVPRRVQYKEHVDDHQLQLADDLAARDLAVVVEADELELDHLIAAAARTVRPNSAVPKLELAAAS